MSGRTLRVDGGKLRKLRAGRGWRQEDLARKAGCHLKSVRNAENGEPVVVPTLAAIAGALKVEPKDLLLADQDQAQPTATFRLQLVIETDIEKLNHSPRLHSLIELLTKMLQAADGEITITDMKAGSIIVTLAMNEVHALQLAALFPDFQEHAREVIRAKIAGNKNQVPDFDEQLREGLYRKPDGKYYTSLNVQTSVTFYLAYLSDMLVLAESVKELRIPVAGYYAAGPSLTDKELSRDEWEIHPDILLMAGFSSDADGSSTEGQTP
jgi:transcriptional regulator with XRE-family HTH domain